MKFETKYNLEDQVYFVEYYYCDLEDKQSARVKQATITGISIYVGRRCKGGDYGYYLSTKATGSRGASKEEELFDTKQKAIDSIELK